MVEIEDVDIDVDKPNEVLNEKEDFKQSYQNLLNEIDNEDEQEDTEEPNEDNEDNEETNQKTLVDMGDILLVVPEAISNILHKINSNYEMDDKAKYNISNDIKLILQEHSLQGEVKPEYALGIHSLIEAVKFIISWDKFKDKFKLNKNDNKNNNGGENNNV